MARCPRYAAAATLSRATLAAAAMLVLTAATVAMAQTGAAGFPYLPACLSCTPAQSWHMKAQCVMR